MIPTNLTDQQLLEQFMVESYEDQKVFNSLTEDVKSEYATKLAIQDLKIVKEKFFKTDLTFIAKTKGRISRLRNIEDVEETLRILENSIESKKVIRDIHTIQMAIHLLKENERLIGNAVEERNDVILTLYTTTVASVIMGTSIILKNSIEDSKEQKRVLGIFKKRNKYSSPRLFISNLNNFIKLVNNGKLKRLAEASKESEGLAVTATATSVATTVSLIGVIGLGSLFLIKEIVYYFYYFKNSVSGYLEDLSAFVELNSTRNTDYKSAEKQRKLATRLQMMADRLNTDDKIAQRSKDQDMSSDKDNFPKASEEDQNSGNSGVVFL